MALLDKVMQMKNQGLKDEEIINQLKREKISPKEITDALNQAQIKKAVGGESFDMGGMEPSIMQQDNEEIPVPQPISKAYSSKTKEIDGYIPSQNQYQEVQLPVSQPMYQQQEYSQTPAQYPEEQYQTYSDTDTIIEISEQVFDEKISETLNQIELVNKFKTISETKLENIENRLKKIESIIDKLQIAILEKIGSYGENLESIKKEMGMMQDSFGKMVNPILNNSNSKNYEKPKVPEKFTKEYSNEEISQDIPSDISSDISSIMKPKKFVKKVSKISKRR